MKPFKKHIISKSTFIRGKQCHKSLYLNKNHKELKDELTEQQKAIFSRGHKVGELAQQLFPGGLDLTPENFYNFIPSLQKTQEAIEKGVEIIYEAAFQHEGVLVLIDILAKKGNAWHGYEVKSAASLKEVYVNDAALQYHVITKSGLKLKDISIIHLNSDYRRKKEIEVKKLFTIRSILEEVKELQPDVQKELNEQKLVLATKRMPNVKIGPHCTSPYTCDFKGFCWKDVPEYSVLNLSRGGEKVWELFNDGIINLEDIPENSDLSSSQKQQLEAEKSKEPIINKKEIKKFTDALKFPLFFLDFETINAAIPPFENTKVYQQLPFQYSIHAQESEDSNLEHHEFLQTDGKDFRVELIQNLIEALRTKGSVLVYNKSFEDRCLKDLAKDFPEYEKDIIAIRKRLVDLAIPFQKKHFYMAEMKGKHSIKNVLPVLVPEYSYDNLEIQNGANASFIYQDILNNTFDGNLSKTKNDLLEYCRLDTLAMVKILEKLKTLISFS